MVYESDIDGGAGLVLFDSHSWMRKHDHDDDFVDLIYDHSQRRPAVVLVRRVFLIKIFFIVKNI